jgi:plasmid segregation protein ParM
MLKGWHTIVVNGIEKSFHIRCVECAAEGISSFWSSPTNGLVRIIDVGSGTVNYSSVLDQRYIDKDSGTLPFGVNTNKTDNLQALSRGIATHILKKWSPQDKTFVVGGIAEQILPHLKGYFSNVDILRPIYNRQYVNPIYANAVAFYIVAVNIYE